MTLPPHPRAPCSGCSCCGTERPAPPDGGKTAARTLAARLSGTALLCAAAFIPPALYLPAAAGRFAEWLPACLFILAWLCAGSDVLLRSARNIRHAQIFDENFLMSVAGAGAIAIGEYPEAVAIMVLYQIGEALQESALSKSRVSIRALLDIRPPFANRKNGAAIQSVPPSAVRVGELILIKSGERVPLDSVIEAGESSLDRSALTGEAAPVFVSKGDTVLAGAINLTGVLTARVCREEGESAIAKMLDLVENAREKKARVENFITQFARRYTPAVVFAALALALLPPFIQAGLAAGGLALPAPALFQRWVYRALVFLVISCPCALIISVPLGFFAGISGASRAGILIKGGGFMETLAKTGIIVFDKTGTLTSAELSLERIEPAARFTQAELLDAAARAEAFSSHPAARAICRRAGISAEDSGAEEVREVAGQGVSARVNGRRVLAGSPRLLKREGVALEGEGAEDESAVYAAIDGVFAGRFIITGALKEDARAAIAELRALGTRKIVMLSGDSPEAAARVAGELGLDEARGGLLPADKVAALDDIAAEKPGSAALIFVGDGVNDAPALARADAGIAMGALGSDAAIEAADVVLMGSGVTAVAQAIQISRKTRRVVRQNIVFALGVKALLLAAGAAGAASIWIAVFGDVGVALIAVLNAMRAAQGVARLPSKAKRGPTGA